MRSRQINFFHLPEELNIFELFFKECEIIYIKENIKQLADYIENEIPRINNDLPFKIFLSKYNFRHKIVYHFDNKKDIYSLDTLRSYLIEFALGGFYPYSSEILHRSRLYFPTNYYASNGEIIEKDPEFVKWASWLMEQVKKKYLKKIPSENNGILFSNGVIDLLEKKKGSLDQAGLKITLLKNN
jgi:hypothetical protein